MSLLAGVAVEDAADAPPTTEVVVRARGVLRRYRNGRGVGPVDVSLRAGEALALMGRNGSGKTTLLRVLATVARPQSGEVRWFGGDASRARGHLGLALDGAMEDAGLTGRQATHFWCAQWITDAAEVSSRTDDVLRRLGLAGTADEPVGSYSYGMRRRLALAAAVVHEPALALLDEPTAGLDPDGCAQLGEMIAERSRQGSSTVIASNDPGFVESVADRVAFLDDGALVRCASPRDLLAALPQGRVAEIVVEGRCPLPALRAVAGVMAVSGDGGAATVRFDGDHTIAALVAAADAPGGRLRELRLRRPDLADCFHELTGRALQDQP
ncbi:MAG TPA: ABC transporter ATP-binding protein [Candidatus Dormibacteraeota bacterium]|jgi:ABC-2 type transport system ATP-binding protein|nr:ABC transporter ATP-binding protein [Candidatus Dormibacteraeota bacterium]